MKTSRVEAKRSGFPEFTVSKLAYFTIRRLETSQEFKQFAYLI